MKKRVHYALLEDMHKYIKEFNFNDYISCNDITDHSVIEYVRDYYSKHLPVDVTAWLRANTPNESSVYSGALGEQVEFIRDIIGHLLRPDYEDWYKKPPLVISTHCSKSIVLPVYQINLEKYGIEFVLRYNFYDWKVSVKSEKALNFNFMELFDPEGEYSKSDCEGFPEHKIYGSYKKNHYQFTIEIETNYDLYTFFFLLKNYLDIK